MHLKSIKRWKKAHTPHCQNNKEENKTKKTGNQIEFVSMKSIIIDIQNQRQDFKF